MSKWTVEEKKLLAEIYFNKGTRYCYEYFPDRTMSAVRNAIVKYAMNTPSANGEENYYPEIHEGNRHVYRCNSVENEKRQRDMADYRKTVSPDRGVRSYYSNESAWGDHAI